MDPSFSPNDPGWLTTDEVRLAGLFHFEAVVFSTGAALLVALSVSWVFVWKEETA